MSMNLPEELSTLSTKQAWLCYAEDYSATKHNGSGGYSKIPYSALTLKATAWQKNLSDFATAAGRIGQAIPGAQVHTRKNVIQPATVKGIGFYLPKSGYIGIDLDEVYDGNSGRMTEEAAAIVRLCGSYTEISPSWRGLHIIVAAEGAPDFKQWETTKAGGKPDIYSSGISAEPPRGEYQILPGYMTVTGQKHIRSQPLRALTPEEWAQLSAFFTRPAKPEPVTSPEQEAPSVTSSGSPSPSQVLRAQPQAVSGDGSLTQSERLSRWQELLPTLSDDDLLTRIFKANHKAEDLFTGDWHGYQSSSEADAALLALFLSYTLNRETAKRLFIQSALYQGDKDPKRRGYAYINLTLRSVEANGITPLAGFIDFTRDDRRNYAIGHEAPVNWGIDEPAGAPSVTSSGQAQPSAQYQAGAPQGSVLRQVQATAQAFTTKPAFDWSKAAGAYFEPDEESIPEGYPIPTGLKGLDKALAGGLFPVLYVMGAISSLGKTSLAVQLADTIAESGRPVLYFSLEMAKRELRAKSLSRLMYIKGSLKAYTSTEIVYPATRQDKDFTEEFDIAKADYSQHIGRNIYYVTGIGSIMAKDISGRVKNFLDLHPDTPKPVVFVDYLQILKGEDPHETDKQRIDEAVVTLKRLSAREKITVFVISSFNRDNYTSQVSETAFKESGAVEYSADVLLGLQPAGMRADGEKGAAAENLQLCERCKKGQQDPDRPGLRLLELKVLKSRVGVPYGSAWLEYNPGYNQFSDGREPKATTIRHEVGQGTGGPSGNNGGRRAPKGSDDNPF